MGNMTWKSIFEELAEDFMAWGCRFSRRKLPEIARGYDCTPLFFWNWMDDPEMNRSEKGFLSVLGYAWRRHLKEETEIVPQRSDEETAAEAPESSGRKVA